MTNHIEQPAERTRLTDLAERLEAENTRLTIPARIEARCVDLTEDMKRVMERAKENEDE